MLPPDWRLQSHPDNLKGLIAACLRGEAAAWETLITRHQGFIYSIAIRAGLSPADADDVFQNVGLRLCLHLQELRDPARFLPWLGAITRQECLRLRSRRVGEPLEEAHGLSTDDGALEGLLREERTHLVRQGLEELSEECRHLLKLLYGAEPLSYAEVATELRIPVGSIGPRRGRCLERLRKSLEEKGL